MTQEHQVDITDQEAEQLENHANSRLALLSANRTCPICKFNKWTFVHEDKQKSVVMTSLKGGYEAYVFWCGRCGHVQQFIKEVLDEASVDTEIE